MAQPEPIAHSQPWKLDRPWVLWLLFFFQFAAIGVYFTYLNIFYREAGLTGTQIGVLNMAGAVAGILGAVVWGYFSDRTGQARYFIAGGAVFSLIVAQLVPVAARVMINEQVFTSFFALAITGSFFGSAPSTLVDSTTLTLLGTHRDDYGRYRLGGSIGYVIATLSSGFLFDQAGLTFMFPAYGIIMAFFAGIALLLPTLPRLSQAARETSKGSITNLLRNPVWILFTVCIFLVWIAANASILFLGVTLDAMGASEALIGIAVTIGAVIEIPIMLYSGSLLRRFGPVTLLTVSMGLMVIRYFLLGIMPAPEWAVPINMINGLAFPFFWNSSVTLANRMAPSGFAGTAQGLMTSTLSLAGMVSSPLTGYLFDSLGPNQLFLVMSASCLAALVLFSAGSRFFARQNRI